MAYPKLPMLPHLLRLKRAQWLPGEELERRAEAGLESVLKAASATPRYAAMLRGMSPQDAADNFESIPLTTRADLQGGREAFLNPAFRGRRLTTLKTAGTTGEPAAVEWDQGGLDLRFASSMLARLEWGMTPFDKFAEIHLWDHVRGRGVGLLSRMGLFRRRFISIFDDEWSQLEAIRAFGATIAGWHPSALELVARENLRSGKRHRLKAAFCGSEVLRPGCRRLISESFSCGVFQQYGTTEFGTIAFECPEEHSLHVNTELCRLEIVDGSGRPMRGGTGRVAVTGLANMAMPLLRYSLGDMASWGKECACGRGFPVLRCVEGREFDRILLPSGRSRTAVSLYLGDLLFLRSWQVVQEDADRFVLRYVPRAGDLDGAQRGLAASRIRACCLGEDVRVEFERLEKPPHTASGKIRLFVSKISP